VTAAAPIIPDKGPGWLTSGVVILDSGRERDNFHQRSASNTRESVRLYTCDRGVRRLARYLHGESTVYVNSWTW
jgi:hypothetical protein